ncbi:hypothetical protein AAFF_G00270140 [Aldrovandia affinis]|uniref:DSN1 n=1 Tax=Aldrovandia affinis TaxID=143900 RepID=A0AAD7RDS8_9TELE|nr:hypothetical protein AAFF_G00270140 [Aldrovandia affinis]
MAECHSRNLKDSFETNNDITSANKGAHAGTKRASSGNPSPEPPQKSPRTARPGPDTLTPGQGKSRQRSRRDLGRRKSWRRSSRVRRSFPALPNTTPVLCRAISPSLPEEKRLEKLMESSMQQAQRKLQERLSSTPGANLDRLQEQVECVQREWCCLAQDIRGEMPSVQPSQTVTERDPGVQKTMEQIKKSVHRLQTECGLWDSLLLKHRSKSEELARRAEQGRAEGVAMDTSCLAQSSQSQLIFSKPDYHSALLRQQAVLHTMELLMDSQCKIMRELLSFQEQSQMLVKETSRRLASNAGFHTLPSSPVRRLLTDV